MKHLYIVAVSGGVDSVVMLHRLVSAGSVRIVVAHVDHGMRAESHADAEFVRELARSYDVPFETIALQLGKDASEAAARRKRWEYLRQIKDRHQAEAIATGHHADDVVETMVINLLRGTGWRGLASLRETGDIKRPLLDMRKQAIYAYARTHGLGWREDETNTDERYLRNYVRRRIMPQWSDRHFIHFIHLSEQQRRLRETIEREAAALPVGSRYHLVMWEDGVAREALRIQAGALPRPETDRLLLFARTALPGKRMPLSNGRVAECGVNQLIVVRGHN